MDDQALMDAARAAAREAYAPYSGVRVGAALLAADGRVFSGCNVENASYGLTICAERNAVARAVGEGVTRFEAVAIWSSLERPLPPCGACRQVLAEFAPRLAVRWASGDGRGALSATLDELLGHAMTPDALRSDGGGPR